MECLPRCLLCMLASMSNSSIFLSLCVIWSSVSLWMSISRPWHYLLVEYPVHHGKLNHRHPISLISGSRVSIFTMASVVLEIPEEVASISLLTFSVYYCWVMGVSRGGSLPLISLIYFSKIFLWSWRYGRSGSVPIRSWLPKGLFPFYFRRSIRGAVVGGVFLKSCSRFWYFLLMFFSSPFWVTSLLVTCRHWCVCI